MRVEDIEDIFGLETENQELKVDPKPEEVNVEPERITDLGAILKKIDLKLDPDKFKNSEIKLVSDIADHAALAFELIYKNPYPDGKRISGIARYAHGIQHVSRVAAYIPVLANLYRRHGDEEALALTPEDLKLLQIAALFHDSAREDEGEDLWDDQSAILLYHYLTDVLKVNTEKAILLAEAVANKDANNAFNPDSNSKPKQYYRLNREENGKLTWVLSPKPGKNIFQKIIHDADSLDIHRARDHFDARYLDFYQDIAKEKPKAFYEMAQLITETRSLIELQGDGRKTSDPSIKKQFENKNAYIETSKMLYQTHYYVLPSLYAGNSLLSGDDLQKALFENLHYDKSKPLTEENMLAAIREGRVFARGVNVPSGLIKKDKRENEPRVRKEVRKTLRKIGVPTRTQKPNRFEKDGNPDRSVSLLGWGGTTFCNVGFFTLDIEEKDIIAISTGDIDVGLGKKNSKEYKEKIEKIGVKDAKKELNDLRQQLKMGGHSHRHGKTFFSEGTLSNHNEIICKIRQADAIYITQDTTLIGSKLPQDKNFDGKVPRSSLLLQAIYIQNEYEIASGKRLPIFEYSGDHNFVKSIPDLDPEQIKKLWAQSVSNFLNSKSDKLELSEIAELTTEKLKVKSVYLGLYERYHENAEILSVDHNYDEKLRGEINSIVNDLRKKYVNTYFNTEKIERELVYEFDLPNDRYKFQVERIFENPPSISLDKLKQLITLLSFMEISDLAHYPLTKRLHQASESLHNSFIGEMRDVSNYNLNSYLEFINFVDQTLRFIDDIHISKIKIVLGKFETSFADGKCQDESFMMNYLKLANFAQIATEAQKGVLLTWLSKITQPLSSPLVSAITEAGLLDDKVRLSFPVQEKKEVSGTPLSLFFEKSKKESGESELSPETAKSKEQNSPKLKPVGIFKTPDNPQIDARATEVAHTPEVDSQKTSSTTSSDHEKRELEWWEW